MQLLHQFWRERTRAQLVALLLMAALAAPTAMTCRTAGAADTKAKKKDPVPGKTVIEGWKKCEIKKGDGHGGWIDRTAQRCLLRPRNGKSLYGFGVAQLSNGEVILFCSWDDGAGEKPVVAFSKDGARTWSNFERIPVHGGRPMMLASLGGGTVTFQMSDKRFVSHDYGRTWPEAIDIQFPPGAMPPNMPWEAEGNPYVEYGEDGKATRMAEIGWFELPGKQWPNLDGTSVFRWSADGGHTWTDTVAPKEWNYQDTFEGKTVIRGVGEGSVTRAADGSLVAALRITLPKRFLSGPYNDNLDGTGVSISKDDGKTWSPIKLVFDAGRHHANLLRLPNDDLLMTVVVRNDVENGELASHRRGCEAILSHDNGETWDLSHKYILDEFDAYDPKEWFTGQCGHLCSAVLKNNWVLTVYNNYTNNAPTLILWKPSKK